jgi:L-malate glycosyltransferase
MTRAGKVLLIAPQAPPYGGMALQAKYLEELMNRENMSAVLVPSNPVFPPGFGFLERLRGVRPFLRFVWFSVQLWRALDRAEVIHVLACSWLYFFLVVYPAVLIGRMHRKRVVLNYRGGEAREFFERYGWALKPAFQMAHVVTSPSKFLADAIENRFHVPVAVVSNVVDSSIFHYRQRTVLRPRILITRHLEKIYDIETVLKAFRIVQANCPEASLWIVGTGSQEQHLRGLVSEWALNRVRFLGQVAHDELPAIYDQCDILLNASRVDNFPGALLEASAAGLAVVSTCAGGIPFIYRNGETALLVEPGDSDGLAAAVMKLLQSPSVSVDLTRAAAALARACDWQEVRRALYRSYGFLAQPSETQTETVPTEGPVNAI